MTHTVWHVEHGLLNLSEPDIGCPSQPELWAKLYRNYQPGILVCAESVDEETECPGGMYVRIRDGLREACHYNPGVHHPRTGEGPRHKALKERVANAAEDAGWSARMEDRGAKRRTDVLIVGAEGLTIGWEIELKHSTADSIKRRTKIAEQDGLRPMWTTDSTYAQLIDRAPWSRINKVSWHNIAAGNALLIRGGAKTLRMEKCERRPIPCPTQRAGRCDGWHGTWEPILGLHLEDMVANVGAGELVPLYIPKARSGNYLWVSAADRRTYLQGRSEPKPEPRVKTELPQEPLEPDPRCKWHKDTGWIPDPKGPRDTGAAIDASDWTPPLILPERPAIPKSQPGRCVYLCEEPARLYPCGWRCDAHRPNSARTR